MEIETISTPPAVADAGGSGEQKSQAEVKKPDTGSSDNRPGNGRPSDNSRSEPTETQAERKLKLKFGKNEREVTEREAIAMAQKGWAADERFKAAAAKEREIKEALEKGDVDFLLRKMKGKSQLDFAREVLRKELERRSMSPEQVEAEQARQELESLKREKAVLEKQKIEAQRAEQQRFYEEQYDRELAQAIQKHGLPKNKYVVSRAVKIASEIVDMGLDPDWDLVVGEAKRQTQEEMVELLGQLEDYGIMGDELPRKISKWLVSKGMTKTQADKEAAKVVKQNSDGQAPVNAPVDSNDWFEQRRKAWAK